MCARVERARERLWACILSHWCPIRVMLTRQLFRQHSTFKYFIWAGPGRQQQAHLETHKFLFFILFCLVLLVTDLWFDSIAIDVLCIHVDVHRGPTYPNGRKSIHGGGGSGGSDCRRGGNVEKIYPVAFGNVFWAASFSPYCILFLSFGFFGFLFYFILWWGSLSLCVAFSLEIASLVEATFRLGNRPNEK